MANEDTPIQPQSRQPLVDEIAVPTNDAVAARTASPPSGEVAAPASAGSGSLLAAEDAKADEDEDPDALAAPVEDAGKGPWAFLLVVAAAVVVLFVLPPLTKAGIWDPYELNVADLARRMALKLHGASGLALEGADNSLPHLNDLGRPQLPFTSIALGFKLFGLQEWAGRAPLALWGLVGAVITYGFVDRLVDRRAGVFSAIALLTMPLYFVHARTMLGDVTTMVSLIMAFGGLAVAAFGIADDGRAQLERRVPWLMLGFVGLVAGFYSRGGVLGLFVPTVAIALAWLVLVFAGRKLDAFTHAIGALTGAVATFAFYKGYVALSADPPPVDLNPWIGAMVHPPSKYPTFDFTLGHLGHALAPWSGFAPFALGRLFIAPPGRTGAAYSRESTARVAILLAASAAFAAHGFLAARTDLIAFSGPAFVAAACGIALRDYERGAHASISVGVGTMVFLGLFHHDFHGMPEKAYQAFAIAQAVPFPESFKEKSLSLWNVVLMGFAGVTLLTWIERDAKRRPFDPRTYLGVLRALRDAWDGMLVLAYFAIVAGTSLAGLAVWVGTRSHAKWLGAIPLQVREVALGAWWKAALGPPAIVLGLLFWADVWLWAFSNKAGGVRLGRGFEPVESLVDSLRGTKERPSAPIALLRVLLGKGQPTEGESLAAVSLAVLVPLLFLQVPAVVFFGLFKSGLKPLVAGALALPSGIAVMLALGIVGDLVRGSRAAFLAVFGMVVGLVLCAGYYPALANQLSPKEVFESYRRFKKDDEPLALLGVGGRTAAYYAGGQPLLFNDTQSAYGWLMSAEPGTRRFLSVKADQLARLNQLFRTSSKPPANIPVLDGRSSQIVLVASALAPGETSENGLDKIILASPPRPQRPLDVNLDDKLQVLGIDITDERGRLVDAVGAGRKFHMKTYFKVLAPVTQEWEGFIHIDGFRRRHNGDHKMMAGKYPLSMWNKDDYLVDDHEFTLEPNFTQGAYTIYFGLYSGESRLKVKSGPQDGENRVIGGTLNVQ